jgi:cytochrome P450
VLSAGGTLARMETPSSEVAFNPFDPAFLADPYPQYAEMRETSPVYASPFGATILFRYDDVDRFLRDPALSVEDRHVAPNPISELIAQVLGDREELGQRSMLNRDPPDHTRLRRLVSKAFTPRALERLRERIVRLVDDALSPFRPGDEMDVITSLAFPVPFNVICEMLGMPPTNRDDVREWSHLLVKSLEPMLDPDLILRIADAGDRMRALIEDVISWKRRTPGEDMLSALIAAEEQGDVLSDAELVEQVMLLFIAGHETTVNLIGNGTLALLRDRAWLDRWRSDASLGAKAIEELLRYDSPVQMSRRITLQPATAGDVQVEAGSFVLCVLASANRDEERWGPTAGALNLEREDAAQHLSFGGGHHYCLGAALARMEGRSAIGEMIQRFPSIELAGEPEWNGRINLRGMSHLPVTL